MKPEETLIALGFTDLESLIYCELLRSSPATGYRLAQITSKAPANIYQALGSLAQKGLVVVDEGDVRFYRPVAPRDVLTFMDRTFQSNRQAAVKTLTDLYEPPETDRIFQIKSVAQIFERARSMISSARKMLLFDLFPRPFEFLRPELERAAASGVKVAGVVYGSAKAGFPCVAKSIPDVMEFWPGQQVTVVSDAREHLIALLSREGEDVLHGMWSDSAYLACMHHNGLSSEIRLTANGNLEGKLAYLGLKQGRPPGLAMLLDQGRRSSANVTSLGQVRSRRKK